MFLLGCDECVRSPLIARSPSPTDPVNIVFHMVGTSVVNDQSYLLNVQASGSYWGSYHDPSDALSEVFNSELTVHMVLAAMKDEDLVLEFEKFFEEVVCFFLFIYKNEDQAFRDPFTN